MDVSEFVRGISLFRRLRPDSLHRIIEHSTVKDFSDGDVVVPYGRQGEILGVILEGRAEVVSGEPAGEVLATLGAGEYFGEMSLLTGEPTSANVQSAGASRVLLIPQETFSLELARNPEAIQELARTLTERLSRRENDEAEQDAVERARRSTRKTRSMRPRSLVAEYRILVLNLGSSSLKYDFVDSSRPDAVFRGVLERIGESEQKHRSWRSTGEDVDVVAAPDHAAALKIVLDALVAPDTGVLHSLDELTGIGHRVVHGGDRYSEPVVIDDAVKDEIRSCSVLAPLHNPVNLTGIEICEKLLPSVPQVAVFDTAFHQTMPKRAFVYGIPYELYEKHRLRRYGFHGTSHKYVSLKAASFLEKSSRSLRMITCHLGNGASVTAVDHGRVIDTSMGLTPLEGLLMGTRSGDVDPGLVLHLTTSLGMAPDDVDDLLNRKSGLLGLSGRSNDMREVVDAAEDGDPRSILAVEVFCYRIKKYIGSYVAALGGLDALVFTGGIGEHSSWIRSRVCQGLDVFGIQVDEERNHGAAPAAGSAANIAVEGAPVHVLVVPTDEEGMIARETVAALRRSRLTEAVHPEEIPIPIGISAHHVHLQSDHVEILFGEGHRLTPVKDLYQPGQFACKESVTLIGPKARIERVRVLGPERKQTQVEIARTEEFKLGIDAPIRASGDLAGSPGLILEGPAGRVELSEGVICALRHVHVSPADALRLAVRDRDMVRVRVPGERELIFGDVLIRVKPTFRLEMHVDTDEANAAEMSAGAVGYIDAIQSRRP
ncbi:MAG: acetate/propionate family kinase [Deltaproteobacteria bacterium]|nr:acetate/propionate family kinase [Deltaproteobacteria bacterium]